MKKNAIFILSLLALSCHKHDVEIEYSLPAPEGLIHWDILKVEGENSVSINDTLKLDVYCPRANSCQNVTQVLSDHHGNRILIKAFGKTNTNSPCLMFALPQVIQYEFVTSKKGVYTLEFIKMDESKIKHTINAN